MPCHSDYPTLNVAKPTKKEAARRQRNDEAARLLQLARRGLDTQGLSKKNIKVGIIGAASEAGGRVVGKESLSGEVVKQLKKVWRCWDIRILDPNVAGEKVRGIPVSSDVQCLRGCNLVVIVTKHPVFALLTKARLLSLSGRGVVLVDGCSLFKREQPTPSSMLFYSLANPVTINSVQLTRCNPIPAFFETNSLRSSV
eukprot:CAMPEP_0177671834 /NCGR_PEP_ID=MMETSP0447-20121125/24966_1 /TAXON_ID=0 /ORGANISM="Stygamoeba regulata, Strain BSH-02190019" /LENGTH=197 /DNA_ID=CAMNT_0019179355 /DNA_START=284 /DNA_END=877 /DNA_ORIENTATION=-